MPIELHIQISAMNNEELTCAKKLDLVGGGTNKFELSMILSEINLTRKSVEKMIDKLEEESIKEQSPKDKKK